MLTIDEKKGLASLESFPLPNLLTLASFGNMAEKFGGGAVENKHRAWHFLKRKGLNSDKWIHLLPSKEPGKIIVLEPVISGPRIVKGNSVVTEEQDVVLSLFPADCYPILFTNKRFSFLSLVHGSRVTIKRGRIVEKTIEIVRQQLGVNPEELIVGIGPGIKKCCYRRGLKKVDLLAMIFEQLAGVPTGNISVADVCTSCAQGDRGEPLFFSHHRAKLNGEKERRFGAFVALKRQKGGSMIGRLEVITGCMFSGKTEELIRRLERVWIARRDYVLIKPTIDNRSGAKTVATHYGRSLESFPLEPGQETISGLEKTVGQIRLRKAAVVAFDEGQFFSPKFPNLCQELVARGKRVIVAGLDLDFRGEPFGSMPALLALADEVTKLQAVCVKCGQPATRTQRLVNGQPASLSNPLIVIGGAEKYEARCQNCYVKPQ